MFPVFMLGHGSAIQHVVFFVCFFFESMVVAVLTCHPQLCERRGKFSYKSVAAELKELQRLQGNLSSVNACYNISLNSGSLCKKAVTTPCSESTLQLNHPICCPTSYKSYINPYCLLPAVISPSSSLVLFLSEFLSFPAVCPGLAFKNNSAPIESDWGGNTSIMPSFLSQRSTAIVTWKPVLGCMYFCSQVCECVRLKAPNKCSLKVQTTPCLSPQ